eukprot:tig00000737_g3811.t1
MRIVIKGGIWKNTEDEILKAAVMKYGKNQWARISSLLVRKSAKQCKARWYEWLDPSIKKTEWTRDEEEKLLHLAKLMPNQWRTVAPIVGRTAAQCLEHYEKLLDAAQGKEDGETDDPRRLRPGEIDPHPETKPARPDPVDMDEDEKEMLSEARARLANTRGKKAKRKARERQLEEARRLAALQKRRELKAAGIRFGPDRRRPEGVDYLREIPFEKRPAPGFYDADADPKERVADLSFVNKTLEELEGKRRADQEARLRRQDARKARMKKEMDLPAALAQINKMNDPEGLRKRAKLSLPEPQISEQELEEIAKISASGAVVPSEVAAGAGGAATKGLLASYQQTPVTAPMRTPRTAAGGDTIFQEAQNLVALQMGETPLKGGENTPLHATSFEGATPKRAAIATPLRDELRINDEAGMTLLDAGISEKQRLTLVKGQLQASLKKLPPPKNEYRVMLPKTKAEEEKEKKEVEDAADVEAKREQAKSTEEQAELARRSAALRRGLPRPLGINAAVLKETAVFDALNPLQQAEELLKAEMLLLLDHDEARYPVRAGQAPNPHVPPLERFQDAELSAAAELIASEVEVVRNAMGHMEIEKQHAEAWEEVNGELVYLPGQGKYGRASNLGKTERVDAARAEFENVRATMEREAGRAAKLEKKLSVVLGGFQKRAEATRAEILEASAQLEEARTELESFRMLQLQERMAGPARLAKLQEEVKAQQEREKGLQLRYARLLEQQAARPAPVPAA